MKAIILAAGLGTRLRPITNAVPKCMVEVAGKPLLEWWFQLLQKHGVTEFLINTHHLPDQVDAFVHEHAKHYGLQAEVVFEPVLLGSAGTLVANRGFYKNEDAFFVVYADNLTNIDLTKLLNFHRDHEADLSIGLFRMPEPKSRGIVELGEKNRILSFVEKPEHPKSDLANGGTYVVSDKAVQDALMQNPKLFDIGKDILQPNLSRAFGLEFNSYLRDIGTIESLNLAQTEWQQELAKR